MCATVSQGLVQAQARPQLFHSTQLPVHVDEPAAPHNPDNVGDEKCHSCHQQESSAYSITAHNHTSSYPSAASVRGSFVPGYNLLTTNNQYLYFRMELKDHAFFQTAIVDFPLADLISRTEKIDIVIGSGRKGQTYLSWTGDQLFELPVSYWTEDHRWVNSPGYTDGLPNFDKVIIPRCLECHSSFFQPIPPPANRFDRQQVELGISCEKCHGPGKAHVALHEAGIPIGRGEAEAIVNPASLSRDRQMSLCALCHAGPGIPITPSFSYKVGDDIKKFISLPLLPASEAADVHGSQVQLLESSRCFKSSQMTCTTCHNVHLPQREAASFSPVCLGCHRIESCGRYKIEGGHIADKCISCHMPLQTTNQIVFDDQGASRKPRIRNHKIGVYTNLSTLRTIE